MSNNVQLNKIKELINREGANTIIEIDGGVTNKNAKQLVEAGADVLVAGSYVFNAEIDEITSERKKKYIIEARTTAMYILSKHYTHEQIAVIFNKERSTITHACTRWKRWLIVDKTFKGKFDGVVSMLNLKYDLFFV